jgi:hypothetical protein
MITINKKFRVTPNISTRPPFNFTVWDNSNSGCVLINPVSGTTVVSNGHLIEFTLVFNNANCIENADIKLRVEDAEGCANVISINVEDPCENFSATEISTTGNYSFSVTPNGGSPNYTYLWSWDNAVWIQQSPQGNNYINLIPRNINLPIFTPVTVLITDSKGCTISKTRNHYFCAPEALPETEELFCNPQNNTYLSLAFNLQVEPCRGGCPIDWDTIEFFNYSNPQLNISQVSPGFNIFIATGTQFLTPGAYTVQYRVKDACGTWSSIGTVTLILSNICVQGAPFSLANETVEVDCEDELGLGDIIEIDLSDNIIPPSYEPNIDWTTFQFVNCGCQSTTSPAGCNIVFNPSTKKVSYEVCELGIIDGFQFTVCDVFGNCAPAHAQIFINLNCAEAPIAVNDDDCNTTCGLSSVINVISNDIANGVFNLSSLMIVDQPNNGTAMVNSTPYNGTITYTPNSGFSGTDTFTYKIANTYGLFSNVATVTIQVICAGEAASSTICA